MAGTATGFTKKGIPSQLKYKYSRRHKLWLPDLERRVRERDVKSSAFIKAVQDELNEIRYVDNKSANRKRDKGIAILLDLKNLLEKDQNGLGNLARLKGVEKALNLIESYPKTADDEVSLDTMKTYLEGLKELTSQSGYEKQCENSIRVFKKKKNQIH